MEPFTRATGLAAGAVGAGAVALVITVGAWEATWAPAAAMTRRRTPQMKSLYFMVDLRLGEKQGKGRPLPLFMERTRSLFPCCCRSFRSTRRRGTGGRTARSGCWKYPR